MSEHRSFRTTRATARELEVGDVVGADHAVEDIEDMLRD